MRKLFAALLVLLATCAHAQSSFLKEAEAKLQKALVAKDTVVLKQLLHKDLAYGHSNGWVQTKADVIKDISGGKLAYNSIESKDMTWTVSGDMASLHGTSHVRYTLDGKPGEMQLHVLQVWAKTNKGWLLLARQGAKL